VVFAGRLEFIKGVHVLVDAIAILARERPDVAWKFKLAGTGDEEYANFIRRKVEVAGLEETMTLLGELQVDELSHLLSHASLSVIPSIWYENLPNALLESYACGTPVIASSLGSLKDAVAEGESGFLFQSGEAAQLAEKLAYCWDHREIIAEMGLKAQRMAETTYSRDQHLNSLTALFSELVEKQANTGR
jgi:glycosyltransferase involved in cell wall biosynthesis